MATTKEGLHARVQARADGRLTFKAACPDASTAGEGGGDGTTGGDEQTAAAAASGGAVGSADGASTLDVALTEEVTAYVLMFERAFRTFVQVSRPRPTLQRKCACDLLHDVMC